MFRFRPLLSVSAEAALVSSEPSRFFRLVLIDTLPADAADLGCLRPAAEETGAPIFESSVAAFMREWCPGMPAEVAAAFRVHLAFALPAALVLLAMLWTGWTRRRTLHVGLGVLFLVLWAGTFVTGIFFLPNPVAP